MTLPRPALLSRPTVSYPGEWDSIPFAATGISQRATTSSRRPGLVIAGAVTYQMHRAVECPDCGQLRRESIHPHSPRFDARGVVVDCVGGEVRR